MRSTRAGCRPRPGRHRHGRAGAYDRPGAGDRVRQHRPGDAVRPGLAWLSPAGQACQGCHGRRSAARGHGGCRHRRAPVLATGRKRVQIAAVRLLLSAIVLLGVSCAAPAPPAAPKPTAPPAAPPTPDPAASALTIVPLRLEESALPPPEPTPQGFAAGRPTPT